MQDQPARLSDTVTFQKPAAASYNKKTQVTIAKDLVPTGKNRQDAPATKRKVYIRNPSRRTASTDQRPRKQDRDTRIEVLEKLKSSNTKFLSD